MAQSVANGVEARSFPFDAADHRSSLPTTSRPITDFIVDEKTLPASVLKSIMSVPAFTTDRIRRQKNPTVQNEIDTLKTANRAKSIQIGHGDKRLSGHVIVPPGMTIENGLDHAKPLIVMFGGSVERVEDDVWSLAKKCLGKDAQVMMINPRNWGDSASATIHSDNFSADARHAARYVFEHQKMPAQNVILYGYCSGAFLASECQLAAREAGLHVAAIGLDRPLIDTGDRVKNHPISMVFPMSPAASRITVGAAAVLGTLQGGWQKSGLTAAVATAAAIWGANQLPAALAAFGKRNFGEFDTAANMKKAADPQTPVLIVSEQIFPVGTAKPLADSLHHQGVAVYHAQSISHHFDDDAAHMVAMPFFAAEIGRITARRRIPAQAEQTLPGT